MGGFDLKTVQHSLKKANIDAERRGETLSLEEFKSLTIAIFEEIKQ